MLLIPKEEHTFEGLDKRIRALLIEYTKTLPGKMKKFKHGFQRTKIHSPCFYKKYKIVFGVLNLTNN